MSYVLVIAEKSELLRAIKDAYVAMGVNFTYVGGEHKSYYFKSERICLVSCYGHMLELQKPEEYDEKYDHWMIKDLPIFPEEFVYRVPKDDETKKAQMAFIEDLLAGSSQVIHAGDVDDEGQLIVDNILRHYKYTKPVKRVAINDNNTKVVTHALNNLHDNEKWEHLGWKAYARSIQDWLVGMNITRLMTKAYRGKDGFENAKVVSVGRVQSTILSFIVERDRAHENHEVQLYYKVEGDFEFPTTNGILRLEKQKMVENAERHILDEKGRLIRADEAQRIADGLVGEQAVILSVETKTVKRQQPLPFNLSKLQQVALRKLKINLDILEKTLQDLKDKHRLITYPRTSSPYLREEAWDSAPSIIASLKAGLPQEHQYLLEKVDTSIKSRAFNSSKVQEHHGICPTEKEPDFSQLTEVEKGVYLLIVKYYVAQFYPVGEDDVTKVVIGCEGEEFRVSSKVVLVQGWREIFGADAASEDGSDDDGDVIFTDLRVLDVGLTGRCNRADSLELKTKPLGRYNTPGLVGELSNNISKHIYDKELRERLRQAEKAAKAEGVDFGGIGTEATLPNIMRTLHDRKYIQTDEKTQQIISTGIGRALYGVLDRRMRTPDMTAYWKIRQQSIVDKATAIEAAKELVSTLLEPVIEQVKQQINYSPEMDNYTAGKKQYTPSGHACPVCKKDLILRDRKDGGGNFWSCTGYPACGFSCPNNNGVPDFPPFHSENCSKCNSLMVIKSGISKKTDRPWTRAECINTKCKHADWL